MGHIPGGREVERSLKETVRVVKQALKQINAHAGKLAAKGDYPGAEELIAGARKVSELEGELESIRKRWRETLSGGTPAGVKALPLWKYYAPTLRGLRDLGGSATQETLEQEMEPKVSELLHASEALMVGRRPKWRVMLRRALRAMEKEGFVQRLKKEWRLSAAGRKAAETTRVE